MRSWRYLKERDWCWEGLSASSLSAYFSAAVRKSGWSMPCAGGAEEEAGMAVTTLGVDEASLLPLCWGQDRTSKWCTHKDHGGAKWTKTQGRHAQRQHHALGKTNITEDKKRNWTGSILCLYTPVLLSVPETMGLNDMGWGGGRGHPFLRMHLWWSLCTLQYLLACQVSYRRWLGSLLLLVTPFKC